MDLSVIGSLAGIASLAMQALTWLGRYLPFVNRAHKPLQGEEVFIVARNIDNRGEIISQGKKPKISIITEKLLNIGKIKTERKSRNKG